MKRILSALVVAWLLWAQPASAAIALLTSGKVGSGTGNTITVTLNTSGASLIAWFVSDYAAVAACTVSDTQTLSWDTSITSQVGATVRGTWYFNKNPSTSATHGFTCTCTGCFPAMNVLVFSGTDTSVGLDQQNGAHTETAGDPTGTFQAGSVTPSTANQVVLAGNASNYDYTSIDGSFTLAQNQVFGTGTNFACFTAYLIQTTATAANPTWTMAKNATNGTYVSASNATFKAAAGGGATSPPPCALRLLGVGCEVTR